MLLSSRTENRLVVLGKNLGFFNQYMAKRISPFMDIQMYNVYG